MFDFLCQLIVDSAPTGIGITALQTALQVQGKPMPRRTIQRRLDSLIALGRIQAIGKSRAVVYVLASTPAASLSQELAPTHTPTNIPAHINQANTYPSIPLSAAAQDIRDHIRKPLAQRPAVGYQRAWLDAYLPNQTAYLTPAQTDRLQQLGRTAIAAAQPQQPAGTYARQIFDRLLVDLSWASSRLEGNTYTQLDTQNLIEFGRAAPEKDALETQMVLNHKAAIEMLVDNIATSDLQSGMNADLDAEVATSQNAEFGIGFNRFTLLNLHAILSDNLIAEPLASGRLRTREVRISGTSYIPLGVPQQLQDGFDAVLAKAGQIQNPFEQAFFAMVHLPYLQPFEDVNKRVSRLAANIPLLRHNLCPLSFVDVPTQAYIEGLLGVYELRRTELLASVFVWAYERSCQRYLNIRQTVGEPDAFRLQYRSEIQQTVQAIVRGKLQGTPADIARVARDLVSADAMQTLVEAVSVDLAHLYEGNVVRYRLKLSELQQWGFQRPG